MTSRCASGCVTECRICNREVAGSNLGRGYFTPRSILGLPSLRGREMLRLGRQRQVWLIPLADETQGVQVKLCYTLTMRVIYLSAFETLRVEALYKSTTFTF